MKLPSLPALSQPGNTDSWGTAFPSLKSPDDAVLDGNRAAEILPSCLVF